MTELARLFAAAYLDGLHRLPAVRPLEPFTGTVRLIDTPARYIGLQRPARGDRGR